MPAHHPSKDWDERERKMVDAELEEGDETNKEKVEVVTDAEEEQEDFPISGLLCIYCHDFAVYMYGGNSMCHDCFNKEMKDLIKNKK